jgi:sugar lactone lactonase YvrE
VRSNSRLFGSLGRVAAVAGLVAGVGLVAPTVAGATPTLPTISVSWSTINMPQNVPDDQTHFGVDAAGNIYTIPDSHGITVYSPTNGDTNNLDPSTNFSCNNGFAVDRQGDVFVTGCESNTIYEVSASGAQSVVTTAVSCPGPLAVSPLGVLYIYSNCDGSIYRMVSGVPVYFNFPDLYVYAMAVGMDGTAYVTDYGYNVERVTASTVTSIGSGFCSTEGVAVDGLGNVYVADEDCYGGLVVIAPGGQQSLMNPAVNNGGCPEAVAYSGTDIYYWDECTSSNYIFTTANTSPEQLQNLQVTRSGRTVTASWNPQFGSMFLCTLIASGITTSTTVFTATDTCTFTGLNPAGFYAVRVQSQAAGGVSPIAQKDAPPPVAVHYTCVKGHKLKHLIGYARVCPYGWHVR